MDEAKESEKSPRGAAAYRLILDRILDGDLRPGDAIVESRLAKTIGVSRTPVREAMHRLVLEGFATITSGAGFAISPLTEREAREVYPLIAGLEVTAIEESGPLLATVADQLSSVNKQLSEAKDIETGIELDSLWHDTLISRCGNQRLQGWVRTLRRTIYRYEIMYMADQPLIAQSVKQHAKLIQLVRDGEVEELSTELKRHYRFGMEAVVLKLAENARLQPSGDLH